MAAAFETQAATARAAAAASVLAQQRLAQTKSLVRD